MDRKEFFGRTLKNKNQSEAKKAQEKSVDEGGLDDITKQNSISKDIDRRNFLKMVRDVGVATVLGSGVLYSERQMEDRVELNKYHDTYKEKEVWLIELQKIHNILNTLVKEIDAVKTLEDIKKFKQIGKANDANLQKEWEEGKKELLKTLTEAKLFFSENNVENRDVIKKNLKLFVQSYEEWIKLSEPEKFTPNIVTSVSVDCFKNTVSNLKAAEVFVADYDVENIFDKDSIVDRHTTTEYLKEFQKYPLSLIKKSGYKKIEFISKYELFKKLEKVAGYALNKEMDIPASMILNLGDTLFVVNSGPASQIPHKIFHGLEGTDDFKNLFSVADTEDDTYFRKVTKEGGDDYSGASFLKHVLDLTEEPKKPLDFAGIYSSRNPDEDQAEIWRWFVLDPLSHLIQANQSEVFKQKLEATVGLKINKPYIMWWEKGNRGYDRFILKREDVFNLQKQFPEYKDLLTAAFLTTDNKTDAAVIEFARTLFKDSRLLTVVKSLSNITFVTIDTFSDESVDNGLKDYGMAHWSAEDNKVLMDARYYELLIESKNPRFEIKNGKSILVYDK